MNEQTNAHLWISHDHILLCNNLIVMLVTLFYFCSANMSYFPVRILLFSLFLKLIYELNLCVVFVIYVYIIYVFI